MNYILGGFERIFSTLSRVLLIVVVSLLMASILMQQPAGNAKFTAAAPGQPLNQSSLSPQQRNSLSQAIATQQSNSGYTSMTAAYYNWSGYAVTSTQPYLEVTSTYVQPTGTCPVAGGWSLFWVGFDGFNNGTVEQSGTAIQCVTGTTITPTYYAWWEMYPTNDIQIMPITIKPGNKVKDTVTYNPANGQYSLAVSDLTNKQQYTQLANCDSSLYCARQSAEWVIERPYLSTSYAPQASWKKITMNNATAANSTVTKNVNGQPVTTNQMQPIWNYTNTNITMINDPYTGETLAKASALNATTGKQFTDTWLNTQ